VKSFSKGEMLQLLSAAKAHSDRDWLMILMAYWHGLRATEVVTLTAGCIEDAFLTVHRLKGSRRTTQPLIEHDELLLNERPAVVEYIRFMHRDEKLFPVTRQTFWRLVKRHGKTAGLPIHKCTPHAAKHSCAMSLINKVGIHNTQTWLGHKSMSSTGEYLKVSDQQASEAVLAAID
jgi:type 1 fimbriae regulatory protein FimB